MLNNTTHRRMAAWITKVLVAAAVLATTPSMAMALDQSPKVNVSGVDVPVGDMLKQIEHQTAYTFAYNKSTFDTSRRVTLQASQADLKQVLDRMLKDSGFTYIISGNHIIIIPVRAAESTVKQQTTQTPSSPRAQARQQTAQSTQATASPIFQASPVPSVPQQAADQPKAVPLPDLPVVKAEYAYVEVVNDEVYMVIPGQQVVAIGDMAPKATAITKPLPELRTPNIPTSPRLAIKTNLLLDATTTMNLGFEVRVSPRWTMELMGYYNPWSWSDNRKWKTIAVQPEFRYWLCDPFAGHFLGVHAQWSHYNVGNLPFGSLKNNRYQGDLAGAGLSYGYSWFLGKRWALEATIGVGYNYMWYQRFDQEVCGNCYGWEHKNYVGITKLGLNLSFLIK